MDSLAVLTLAGVHNMASNPIDYTYFADQAIRRAWDSLKAGVDPCLLPMNRQPLYKEMLRLLDEKYIDKVGIPNN